MKKEFSALGIVHNRNVNLVHDERINKILSMSLSKLESIKNIIEVESVSLKEKLKCVVLTDYIKLKTKSYIGNDKPLDCFGTLPIFEYLRRANLEGIKLCCLSGSICIIPNDCISYLNNEFEYEQINNTEYSEIIINVANRKKLVLKITELLNKGLFNVLIGTKALLGEGWDSPCINTLIMASFIGSYVLSNQMRGRAIRTDLNNPDKIANVWHLVCLNPYDYNFSSDYQNLEKRFTTFVGVSNKKNVIENGVERLGFDRMPYTHTEMEQANKKTIMACKDRNKIKQTWRTCIDNVNRLDVLTKVTTLPRRRLKKEYSFYSAFIMFVLCLSIIPSSNGLYVDLLAANIHKHLALFISLLVILLIQVIFLINGFTMVRLINPEMKLLTFGKATLNSLKKANVFEFADFLKQ